MLYIGIDPGETWCGFAALDMTSEGIVRAEARAYHIASRPNRWRSMAHDIFDLLPHARPVTIVAEDFQIRKVGHQRFDHGDTLRLLGALEYRASEINMFTFHLVRPNDHSRQEVPLLFGQIVGRYRKQWPAPRNAAWEHCMSAWRVLGAHLLSHQLRVLHRLRTRAKKSTRCDRWLPSLQTEKDFVAPSAVWLKQF